ncbi:MAG: PQQ-like beta-propeller repeat protein [Thermoleophilia bacterium]|nr:PQQ-like beta-propeller repeat protein [Thermoleophilia bacterium]
MADDPQQQSSGESSGRGRRRLVRGVAALLVVAWASGIVVAALAVRAEPERSELDTTLDGVDEPQAAIVPRAGSVSGGEPAREFEQPCWPTYGRTPARTSDAADLDIGIPKRRTWRMRVGMMEFPPSYCDGVLYVNNQHGETFAIRVHDREVLWRRRTAKTYDSTPAINGRRMFVGSYAPGDVQALERMTGRRLWRLRTGGHVESSPVVVDGLVYAASSDRRVYAIDEETGKVRWAFRTGAEIKDSPSVAGGRVYVGNYAAEVFALDARTGKVRWRRGLGGVRGDRIYSSIAVAGNTAYFATVRGDVYALDARNGRTRWHVSVPGYAYATPAVSGGRVFIANYPGDVFAFDARTGKQAWKQHLGGSVSGSPTVIGDVLYVSSLSSRRSWGLRVRDGRPVWRHDDGRYVTAIATSTAFYLSTGSMLSRWSPVAARTRR